MPPKAVLVAKALAAEWKAKAEAAANASMASWRAKAAAAKWRRRESDAAPNAPAKAAAKLLARPAAAPRHLLPELSDSDEDADDVDEGAEE